MVVIGSLSVLFIYFSVFAFLGWIGESIFKTIKFGKFINSGFLFGPFAPIYGFGAVAIYILSTQLQGIFIPLALLIFFIAPLMIEYFTSWLLEKVFKIRLWDYSNEKFNLDGRVCLRFSLGWFLLAMFTILFIQPYLIGIITKIPQLMIKGLVVILTIYFIIDTAYSARLYYHFSKFRERLKHFIESEARENIENFFKNNPKLLEIGDILKPFKVFPYLRERIETNKKRLLSKIKVLKRLRKKALKDDSKKS